MISTLFGGGTPTPIAGTEPAYDGDVMTAGTIWRYDPTHPVYGLKGVPPVIGGVAYNAAWRNLAKLMGYGPEDEALCHGAYTGTAGILATNRLELGVSLRGGLEIVPSQVNGVSGDHFIIDIPLAVRQYAAANMKLWNATETEAKHRFVQRVWSTRRRAGRTDSGLTGQNGTMTTIEYAGGMKEVNLGTTPGLSAEDIQYSAAYVPGAPPTNIGVGPSTVAAPVLDVPAYRNQTSNGFQVSVPTGGDIATMLGGWGYGHGPERNQASFINSWPSTTLYLWDITDTYVGDELKWGTRANYLGRTADLFQFVDYSRLRDPTRAAFEDAFAPGGYLADDVMSVDLTANP